MADHLKIAADFSTAKFHNLSFVPAGDFAVVFGEPGNAFNIGRAAVAASFSHTRRDLLAGLTDE
ncbi:MAG: hypothetical protein FD159_1975 [Syntrophaceae bacterium]|nr:MAG: hypothetical protein FD159_1975 [Syntrophaceae bacterium]